MPWGAEMADIFISYSKNDAQLTMDLARDLEARGYTTWWDTSLLPGDEFPAEIQRQINAAKVVIVIWTNTSVNSRWVNAEAKLAHDQNKLITTHVQGFKLGGVPLPFNTLQSSLVTDRARIFDALARRRMQPIRAEAPTMRHTPDRAPQATTDQTNRLEREKWQSVVDASDANGKWTAATKYLNAFPGGVWAPAARMIRSLALQWFFVLHVCYCRVMPPLAARKFLATIRTSYHVLWNTFLHIFCNPTYSYLWS
jgi:hypothetical protein